MVDCHGTKGMWVDHSWPWPWRMGNHGGWVGVLDSNWGHLRRRRAVDISSDLLFSYSFDETRFWYYWLFQQNFLMCDVYSIRLSVCIRQSVQILCAWSPCPVWRVFYPLSRVSLTVVLILVLSCIGLIVVSIVWKQRDYSLPLLFVNYLCGC